MLLRHVLMSSSYRGIQMTEGFQVIIVVLVTEVSKRTPRGREGGREGGRERRRRREDQVTYYENI